MSILKRFISEYAINKKTAEADFSIGTAPFEPPINNDIGDYLEASYEIRVEHVDGEKNSLIDNDEDRNKLYSAMEKFILEEPCLPALEFNDQTTVHFEGKEYNKPEGGITIDTIRGGISAYTFYPHTIENFNEWVERINRRLSLVFQGDNIRAYVLLDDE